MRHLATVLLLVAAPLTSPSPARAEGKVAPLRTLPAQRLAEVAPLLRSGVDLAVLETGDDGRMRQITTFTLCAAAPEKVHDVVIHPERYPGFVKNMTKSTVTPNPDGSFDHQYELDYKVTTLDGRHRYRVEPGAAGPVELSTPSGDRHYRFEFLPWGSGTLVVLYGYNEIPRQGLWKRMIDAAPTLEYGLAMTPQLSLMLSMKAEAERLAGRPVLTPPATGPRGSHRALLDLGLVVLFRRTGEGLEISLTERTGAAPEALLSAASQPGKWSTFVPSITSSYPTSSPSGLPSARVTQSIPLLSWETTFGVRTVPGTVDLIGLEGDLRGARMRWDIQPAAAPPPAAPPTQPATQIVLRANTQYQASSVLFRQLYRIEPTFEYGFDVGLLLVILRGVETRALRP